MQPDEDDHAVLRPAVHVAHDHAEGNVEVEVLHVPVRVLAGGPVIEHQHHAGDDGAQVEQEGQAARAPGVPVTDAVAPHLRRMQVQPDVGRNLQYAVARSVGVAVAEDRPPDVVVGDELAEFWLAGLGVRQWLRSAEFDECARVVPLTQLVAITEGLIDDELAVVAERDLNSLERPRRRSFEVDSVFGVARAVAGALELVLGAKPARRAAEMGADAEQRIEAAVRAHDPDALALHPLFADVADGVFGRIARLEAGGRLEEDAREEQANDGATGDAKAGENCTPAGQRSEVTPRPDEVTAFGFGDAWISAGHLAPSLRPQEEGVFLAREQTAVKRLRHSDAGPRGPNCRDD